MIEYSCQKTKVPKRGDSKLFFEILIIAINIYFVFLNLKVFQLFNIVLNES